jgi:Icc-related predicted phosphoesterase
MKLWILSDLHLEAVPNPDGYMPPLPDCDVLVCAGDVFEGYTWKGLDILKRLARGKPVVWVLGNHEFWGEVVSETRTTAKRLARSLGVALLDGDAVTLGDVTFVGATLWSDFMLGTAWDASAETGEQIDVAHDGGSHLITVADARRLHAQDRGKLEAAIAAADPEKPLVVVTHHAPHPDCLGAMSINHPRAGLLASDLSTLTDSGHIKLWVHGHVHHSVDVTRPGETRIIANPAGVHFSNTTFNEALVIEV